jgi:PEGA domain-containing protein
VKNYAYLIFLVFLTTSCATIISGSTQEVSFNSEPQGVEVTVGGKVIGKTPVTLQMDKKSGQMVEFNLEGYRRQTRSLETRIDGWFWGNIVLGGLFGSTTDGIAGSVHEYSPGQYFVTMAPVNSNSVNSMTSDKAKIKEFIVVSYKQIISESKYSPSPLARSLISLLKVEDSSRSEAIEKVKSLSETYKIIPEFAEQVASSFQLA